MISQIHNTLGNLKTVVTDPVKQTASSRESQHSLATKILALTGALQTTLEVNELVAIFSKEIRKSINFDGLSYQFPSLKIDIRLGDKSFNSCAYQLVVASDHIGDIKFFRRHPFQESELEDIENLLSGLLYPLRNALLYQQAVQSSSIDPLTGVNNRLAMDSAIKREIGLSRRSNSPLAFIMFDIDHFKSINDKFGHPQGDRALKAIAQCTEETIRESDMLFRYGGEEFLILLNGIDLLGAQLLAERIRHKVQNLNVIPKQNVKLTISLGVTILQDNDDAHSLIERMDKALYQAKSEGRNRVVVD